MDDIISWMTLSQLPGIGVASFWNMVNRCGGPTMVLGHTPEKLAELTGISLSRLKGLGHLEEVRKSCTDQLARLTDMGGTCICYEDSVYPEILKHISHPPPLLYCLGTPGYLGKTGIGIVGSRASTGYGNRISYSLARNLAMSGVSVISGMAAGIDAESHRGALSVGGVTVAVLGCGVDVVYPSQNRRLYKQMMDSALLVSEYPLGTKPEGFRFPARNRIIAGLSRGVVVVEAAKKSGSLITAQIALEEGREVYGVPGQIDSYKSEGTHWLLQQGAKLVQTARDILEDLEMLPLQESLEVGGSKNNPTEQLLEPEALELLRNIEVYPISRERLIEKCGLPVARLSELLLFLELEGCIEVLPGDLICRNRSNYT